MPTIRLGQHSSLPARHLTYTERVAHAKALAAVVTSTYTTIDQRARAADSLTLRGIPAIGRSVQGAIPGTNPEKCLR